MTNRTLRRDALAIFRASLVAADPAGAVERYLSRRSYERFRRIYVIGAGKAGAAMARAAERVLGRRITGGLINVKDGHVAKLRRIELNECGHPVPDERGVAGGQRNAPMPAAARGGGLVVWRLPGRGAA